MCQIYRYSSALITVITICSLAAILGSGTSLVAWAQTSTANLPSETSVPTSLPNKYPTSTSLASSLNPSPYGQAVALTAKITTTGPMPPTGKVTFISSGNTLGPTTLDSGGVAKVNLRSTNAGSCPVIAVYLGDANNQESLSAVLNQIVEQTTSLATITSAPNPSSVGQTVTFTARVISSPVIPKGAVTFAAGTKVLGMAQLTTGRATFSTASLPVGSLAVKLSFEGNSNITGSTAVLIQVVQP
jgi:Big-like domain-containing protein